MRHRRAHRIRDETSLVVTQIVDGLERALEVARPPHRMGKGSPPGPVGVFEDIDAAIGRDVDNLMPPPSAAETFFGPANRQMWKAIDE